MIELPATSEFSEVVDRAVDGSGQVWYVEEVHVRERMYRRVETRVSLLQAGFAHTSKVSVHVHVVARRTATYIYTTKFSY